MEASAKWLRALAGVGIAAAMGITGAALPAAPALAATYCWEQPTGTAWWALDNGTISGYPNIRSAPSTSCGAIWGVGVSGQAVDLECYVYRNGYSWYYVHYNGGEGWIRGDFLRGTQDTWQCPGTRGGSYNA